MARSLGAPTGNQYAKKENPGRTTSLYITGEEKNVLQALIVQQGIEPTPSLIDSMARSLLKDAIQQAKRKLRKAPKREAEGDAA